MCYTFCHVALTSITRLTQSWDSLQSNRATTFSWCSSVSSLRIFISLPSKFCVLINPFLVMHLMATGMCFWNKHKHKHCYTVLIGINYCWSTNHSHWTLSGTYLIIILLDIMQILLQFAFFYKCLLLNKVLFIYSYNYSQYTRLVCGLLRHFATIKWQIL